MRGDNLEALHNFFLVVSFVLGGMVGSFLNVCVHRLPKGESIIKPRSKCPKCGEPIHWFDNIPVVSWVILRGKCRGCRAPISWMYPVVEFLTAVSFLGVYWKFGMTIATPIYMGLAAALVLVTFVDLTDWTIPNEVTFPGMPIGIAVAVLAMVVPDTGLVLSGDNAPLMSLLGLLVGGGSLWLLDVISLLLLKKRGMGFGDVKLMAMLGAFFGPAGVLLIIVVAAVFGSVVGIALLLVNRGQPIQLPEEDGEDDDAMTPGGNYLPFGPCIVVGGFVYLFVGPQIIQWYLDGLTQPGVL
jgi:leader peptidase (prepilin peptidase)/N-methyltransferase